MLRISELRSGVQKALDHDPDIISKSPREQFEKLLLQPLLDLNQLGQQSQIIVIVIDALVNGGSIVICLFLRIIEFLCNQRKV